MRLCDAKDLAGKTAIDATNPIERSPAENGVLKFFTTLDDILMEQLPAGESGGAFREGLQQRGKRPYMVGPDFGGTKPTMFICGNDKEPKGR